MINYVTIELSEEDAKKFVEFQKNQRLFNLLLSRGVFDQRNCAVTLHFDNKGTLQTIQRADFLYSLKHDGGY